MGQGPVRLLSNQKLRARWSKVRPEFSYCAEVAAVVLKTRERTRCGNNPVGLATVRAWAQFRRAPPPPPCCTCASSVSRVAPRVVHPWGGRAPPVVLGQPAAVVQADH